MITLFSCYTTRGEYSDQAAIYGKVGSHHMISLTEDGRHALKFLNT
jgi:hypothetical protein